MENRDYDIIVVGAGHAGCEAASVAANRGSKVLLITMDMNKIAFMSCNPAIGGIAKGQIVREIDALGGYTGIVTDRSMLQFRMLNRSKGPAMWSPRAQCDRVLFSLEWRKIVENIEGLDLWQDVVDKFIFNGSSIAGVRTKLGVSFYSKAVILTNGTFENGLIHVGAVKLGGGRMSDPKSEGISSQLRSLGFEVGRMKTGTPARIDARSINFKKLIEQKGDKEGGCFSYLTEEPIVTNHSCYIAHTNEEVHKVLSSGFDESPLFNGTIDGVGPRYCPSIEDKLITFSDKKSHQLFLEPEGFNTNEYYINGFSSSLPLEVQLNALRKIEGLEEVKIYRPGYAIEYDYYPPTQLEHTLETKKIKGLFFAGQINGTTGYEEAAGQGLIAGINAHSFVARDDYFIVNRNEGYIGVLIDDLVTKGVDEPYRMFTSRAEYRLLLRQDNSDIRLTKKAIQLGTASEERIRMLNEKEKYSKWLVEYATHHSVSPNMINSYLKDRGTSEIRQKVKLIDIIKRPQIELKSLLYFIKTAAKIKDLAIKEYYLDFIETSIKYAGYLDREKALAEKINRLEKISIPKKLDYDSFKSISTEARQKLNKIRPKTIGQASRISGVSPADLNVLLVYMGR